MSKSNPDKLSKKPSKKYPNEKQEKRHPNPEDPIEEKGPPIKEMPKTGNSNREGILNKNQD